MKITEIKEMTDKELVERLQIEKENLVRLKLNHAVSPLDNPNKLRDNKRNIARIKTVLRDRELNANQK